MSNKNTSLTPNRNNFKDNFIKQFGNGKKLMEDFGEFIAQSRQILISNGRRKRKVNNLVEKNANEVPETIGLTINRL